jgi:hypothetical protein
LCASDTVGVPTCLRELAARKFVHSKNL